MTTDLTYSRFELKYRIHYMDFLKVRNALKVYMKKDKYTLAAGGRGYLVRSLYFDSDDFTSYHEKMNGNGERLKLRIRSYSRDSSMGMPIKAELKIRQGNLVIKKTTSVNESEYREFMETGHWKNHQDPVLTEFESNFLGKTLRPKVLIEYLREGYESKLGNNLRITFDHKVRSAHADDLFPGHLFFREHNPHEVILEIKFKDEVPIWVKQLVFEHGLKIIANSKFTQGIQAARNELHHPGGVVIIR